MNRGGSFNNAASNARSANRNNNTPENRDNNLGLRPSKATHRPIAPVPLTRSTRVAQSCIPCRRRNCRRPNPRAAAPSPGTEDFATAVKQGYVPPRDFHEWGKCFEYKYNSHNTPLPDDVRETWRLYNNTSAIYDRKIHEGPKWMRETLAQIAGWRLKKQRYGFPLEQKLFDIYVRATGQLAPGGQDYVPAVDA